MVMDVTSVLRSRAEASNVVCVAVGYYVASTMNKEERYPNRRQGNDYIENLIGGNRMRIFDILRLHVEVLEALL